jgi:DNA-binding beta-propeller fold protein YncE
MRMRTTFWVAVTICGALVSAARAERLVLVAGGSREATDVPAVEAQLHQPFGIDQDAQGRLFVVEFSGGRVLSIDRAGQLALVAGDGGQGFRGDGGPARAARFDKMHALAVSPTGLIYLADTLNHRVRVLDPEKGTIATWAGCGRRGASGDGGPALEAEFNGIYCIALTPRGDRLYVADLENRRIRMIDVASGIVSTVAGNGQRGVPQDGAVARESPLVDPRAVAADDAGNVYILERGGNALRVVDREGHIRTVAGNGAKGKAVDRVAALEATFDGPKHLCLDRQGNVIIADTENHVIRRYLPGEGAVVRLAGSGQRGKAGLDGPPLAAQLSQPHGVFVDPAGRLYIVDSMNDRVLKVVGE